MNIAFPALLIVLLASPGLFFNLAYYEKDNKPLNYVPLSNKAAISLFVTLILHIVWIGIINLTCFSIDYNQLLILISGAHDNLFDKNIQKISGYKIFGFLLYLTTICIGAYFSGILLRNFVEKFKIDRKLRIFRLSNEWYYLFNAYDNKRLEFDIVIIGAVLEIGGKGYLYTGLLEDFFLNEQGNLDRLIISSHNRRLIENDKKPNSSNNVESRFYEIEGDYFVIPYTTIKNLNLLFIKFEPED